MSGHSKWATTKHKKAVIDARRGKLFAKLIKNIEVAARTGGGDPAGNPTLYDAIQKAKKSSVPNDNIDRAVKRGSGAEAGGADYQTIMYEGYGPNGVALLIECLTDNKNRAAMEVRTAMTRNGGSLADPGSVSYLFNRKGVVIVPQAQEAKQVTEDDVLEATLDAGAEEVNDLGESFEVISEATDLVAVRTALQAAGVDYDSAEASFVPSMQVELDEDGGRQGVPARRGARGPRRRAERVRATSTSATRSWSPSTPDRVAARRARRDAAASVSVGPNRCSDERLSMRVLGIDPGLTRCGLGVVEGSVGRPLSMVAVGVVRTPPGLDRGRCGSARSSAASRPGSTSTARTPSPSSGCSASTTSAP